MNIVEQPLDLANIVDNEVKPSTPVLMCSVPGYDASGLVRDLAAEENKQITSISIGKKRILSLPLTTDLCRHPSQRTQ